MVVIQSIANGTGMDPYLLSMEKDSMKDHSSYTSESQAVT
jgi:hypothetical protein